MMKSKTVIAIVLMGGLCCSAAFATGKSSQSQQSQGSAQGGAQGGMQGGSMNAPNPQTGSQKTPNQVIRDINSGQTISEEDAATLVMGSGFMNELKKDPRLATALSKHPFAANLFYTMPSYKSWSTTDPDNSKKITDAAMKWNKMSQTEKDKFFAEHPTLQTLQGSMGGMQGGAQGGAMGGSGSSQGSSQGGAMGGSSTDTGTSTGTSSGSGSGMGGSSSGTGSGMGGSGSSSGNGSSGSGSSSGSGY